MDILKHLAFENLKKNKKRTISTVIGITLMAALICGTATLVTSFQKTLVQDAVHGTGYYHFKVEGLTDEELSKFEENKKIKNIYTARECGYSYLERL